MTVNTHREIGADLPENQICRDWSTRRNGRPAANVEGGGPSFSSGVNSTTTSEMLCGKSPMPQSPVKKASCTESLSVSTAPLHRQSPHRQSSAGDDGTDSGWTGPDADTGDEDSQ